MERRNFWNPGKGQQSQPLSKVQLWWSIQNFPGIVQTFDSLLHCHGSRCLCVDLNPEGGIINIFSPIEVGLLIVWILDDGDDWLLMYVFLKDNSQSLSFNSTSKLWVLRYVIIFRVGALWIVTSLVRSHGTLVARVAVPVTHEDNWNENCH